VVSGTKTNSHSPSRLRRGGGKRKKGSFLQKGVFGGEKGFRANWQRGGEGGTWSKKELTTRQQKWKGGGWP